MAAAVWEPWLDATLDRGHRTGEPVTDLDTVGPFKILADGSLNTRTLRAMPVRATILAGRWTHRAD